MSETTVIKTGEEDAEHPIESTERIVGELKNEAEHVDEELGEHENRLTNVEQDKEWIQNQLNSLREEMAALPRVAPDTLEAIASGIAALEERLKKVEEAGASSTQSLTHPLEQSNGEEKDKPQRRGILDRLI